MPGGCGLDVLDVIKRERPATRVIVLTNYPLPQFRKRSADAGAEWFFDKTQESKRVAEVLHDIVAERGEAGTAHA
jgi:two-component system response regulator DesR